MTNLARNLRPTNFSELVGQDTATKIVLNGLQSDALGSVCLFFGPAGVGKTTLARLIAKWYACTSSNKPCNQCRGCTSVNAGTHPDVVEVDAATQSSVEHTRNLLEGSQYKPTVAEKRIYILDEVHMLSKHAVSALLKTLEDPPVHTKFILATTEVEKLPKTLLSRAFKIMLNPIAHAHVHLYLKTVCEKHGWKITDQALDILVMHAQGSLRQALSYLEQAALLCKEEITSQLLSQLIGNVPQHVISSLLTALTDNNKAAICKTIQSVDELNPSLLVKQLLQHIRKHLQIKQDERLIQIGYKLAECSIVLHQTPYPADMVEILLCQACNTSD